MAKSPGSLSIDLSEAKILLENRRYGEDQQRHNPFNKARKQLHEPPAAGWACPRCKGGSVEAHASFSTTCQHTIT
jgi:hypothetical protein